jgi:membrane fusion protein, multidrug efflux system
MSAQTSQLSAPALREPNPPIPNPRPAPQGREDEAQTGVKAAPARAAPPADSEKGGESGGRSRLRRTFFLAVGGAALAVAAVGGYLYWDSAAHFASTDDAFVAARQYAISPKVSGYLTAVDVTDNQHVAKGDVIARVDQRDYLASLAQAKAQVAAAQASIGSDDAQISAQQAQVDLYQANVEQAEANLNFAKQQAARYDTLAHDGSGSVQNAQQYSSQLAQQQAALKSAQASVAAAKQQVEALKAQRANAVATLAQANAQLDQAELNLGYTEVTAAQAGRVVQLSGSVGQLAQAGANLAILVPDEIWVTANFKETQLAGMKPGQPVTMEVDAYPKHDFQGHIDSVQPGSGTAFSLLPAENATGNYVKIVQRVPVKIVLDNPPPDLPLGPGMSVVPTVRIDPSPTLIERIRSAL